MVRRRGGQNQEKRGEIARWSSFVCQSKLSTHNFCGIQVMLLPSPLKNSGNKGHPEVGYWKGTVRRGGGQNQKKRGEIARWSSFVYQIKLSTHIFCGSQVMLSPRPHKNARSKDQQFLCQSWKGMVRRSSGKNQRK